MFSKTWHKTLFCNSWCGYSIFYRYRLSTAYFTSRWSDSAFTSMACSQFLKTKIAKGLLKLIMYVCNGTDVYIKK